MDQRNSTRPTKAPTAPQAAKLPDLSSIVDALRDAQALVSVAHAAVVRGNHYGLEERVLRLGVATLADVYHRLDEADVHLAEFLEKNGLGSRGAA